MTVFVLPGMINALNVWDREKGLLSGFRAVTENVRGVSHLKPGLMTADMMKNVIFLLRSSFPQE